MARRNPPIAKDPDDFKEAMSLAQRMLSKRNPDMQMLSPTLDMRANITRMGMTFQQEGRNLSALSPEDWLALLQSQGIDPDVAASMVEEIASWGVDDRIE
jgi:hypothetical protein